MFKHNCVRLYFILTICIGLVNFTQVVGSVIYGPFTQWPFTKWPHTKWPWLENGQLENGYLQNGHGHKMATIIKWPRLSNGHATKWTWS